MSNKVERALVQGTVTFTVSCNDLMGLVEPEVANSGTGIKNWLRGAAMKSIEIASVDVEIDNVETVHVTKETAEKYTGEILGGMDWKEIKKEDKMNG